METKITLKRRGGGGIPQADGASDTSDVEPGPEAKAGSALKLTENAPPGPSFPLQGPTQPCSGSTWRPPLAE